MDETDRQIELAKARILELDAALLVATVSKCGTYEELRSAMLKNASVMKELCAELRAEAGARKPDSN